MNIAAYCRVSTDKEDQMNSLDVQKAFFSIYAEKNNYNLIKVYADEGISGTKIKNRKQFLQLMKDSNYGLYDMVVVKDISRFARNAVDFLQSMRELKAKGIPCKFITSNLSTEDGELILGMLALVAQEESGNTSKRIKFSKRMNAEKGKVPNLVYGYNKTCGDYFNLEINAEEAETIKRIYQMYLHGYGQNKIAVILNDEGKRTKRNCRWSQNAIARILSNPLYTGKVINGKQEIKDYLTGERSNIDQENWLVTERTDLKIVGMETFEQVQKIVRRRHNKFNLATERRSNKHIFSTLIRCKCCGYSYRRTVRTYKNTYIDWVCSRRNTKGVDSCPNKTALNETELLEEIRRYFISLLTDKPNVINNIIKEFNRIYESRDNNIITEKSLTDRLKKLKRDKQKYIDMSLNDIITIGELKEKTYPVNDEIERIENELRIVECNLSKKNRLEEVLDITFKDIENIVHIEDWTNLMLKRVLQKIVVDESGNIDIYLNFFSDIGLNQNVLICHNGT